MVDTTSLSICVIWIYTRKNSSIQKKDQVWIITEELYRPCLKQSQDRPFAVYQDCHGMAERTPDNSLLLWIPKMLLKTCNQLNPLLPLFCCTAEQAPSPCRASGAEAHTTVWKAWNTVKIMSGFSAIRFHLTMASELQKPSCSLYIVRKEESAEFSNIISRLVSSGTSPCASLAAKLPCDAPLSTQSHRWKNWQVNLQASCSRDVLCVHNTKEKQDSTQNKPPAHSHPSASCPQAESHLRRYFIFLFQAVYYH